MCSTPKDPLINVSVDENRRGHILLGWIPYSSEGTIEIQQIDLASGAFLDRDPIRISVSRRQKESKWLLDVIAGDYAVRRLRAVSRDGDTCTINYAAGDEVTLVPPGSSAAQDSGPYLRIRSGAPWFRMTPGTVTYIGDFALDWWRCASGITGADISGARISCS